MPNKPVLVLKLKILHSGTLPLTSWKTRIVGFPTVTFWNTIFRDRLVFPGQRDGAFHSPHYNFVVTSGFSFKKPKVTLTHAETFEMLTRRCHRLYLGSEALLERLDALALKKSIFDSGHWDDQFFVCCWILVWGGNLGICYFWGTFSIQSSSVLDFEQSPWFWLCKPKLWHHKDNKLSWLGITFFKATDYSQIFCPLECLRLMFWNLWHKDNFKAEMCIGLKFSYLISSGC